MAKEILKNASIHYGRYEIASDVNQLDLGANLATVDVTNFGSEGWNETLAGLKSSEWSFEGFMEIGDDSADQFGDEQLLAALDALTPVTVTKTRPAAVGDVAWGLHAIQTYLTDRKDVGQAHGFALRIRGGSPTIRGKIIDTATRTASGNSAELDLGSAVAANERLYLLVHVLEVSGTAPTLDLELQSDDTGGFPSAVSRITVPQFTAPGSYLTYVTGAITDQLWRLDATIGGTTPSFRYVAMIGKAPFN